MGSAPDIVDISSDEEDAYDDLISEFFGCIEGEPEGFDDVEVMEELSAPKPAQKKGAPQDDLDNDCLILDEDPDKPVNVVDDKHGGGDGSDDLLIVGEKGQLACRDYPHPRHLCANFPFSSTPHEKYCDLCHCYVCDSPAPCSYWRIGFPSTDHCHSTDKDGRWIALRKSFKLRSTAAAQPPPPQKSDTSLSMMMPLQNRVSDRHPNPAPRPILSSKSSTLRPCPAISVATRSTISQRHHPPPVVITYRGQRLDQNLTRSQSLISATQYAQREKRTVGALAAQVMQPQAKFRRVESNRSSLISNSTKRSQHGFSSHIQACGAAPQITQDQPATAFQENMTWQDILKGVAAELGVSDNYSRSSTSNQSPAVSSQPTAFSHHLRQKSGSPNVDVYAHSTPSPIQNSSSLGFDCGWLDSNTAAENIAAHGGAEDPQAATRQPTNPVVSKEIHMESFLASVEEQLPEVGKQPGLPELDPVTQLLYDFDSPWSSTAQV